METAQFAVTTYDEVYKFLQTNGKPTRDSPLKIFLIPAIVMCTEEGHPECHEQFDFADINAIPALRQEGNPRLITILSNLTGT